jgi:hypothetical protein
MSDEIVRTQPGGQNGALARLNPQWFAHIREVDESIFISNDELFRMSRVELKELRDRMLEMAQAVSLSNNAFAQMRFSTQSQTLTTWQQWLDYPTHTFFDSTQGYKLLLKGDVPITAYLLDQAYARLVKAPEFVEPEIPPTISVQPKSVVAEPLELVTFSVFAQGSQPMDFAWLLNEEEIFGPDAKKSSYSTVCTEFNNGAVFSCRVSNRFGQIVSTGARLCMIRRSI